VETNLRPDELERINCRRRSFCIGTAATSALATMGDPARSLTVQPRQRVIIDNDFSGDPDGLFQLAHHLASASIQIPFVVGSHIHTGDFLDPSITQSENAVRLASKVASLMRLDQKPTIVAGRSRSMEPDGVPDVTATTKRIVAEAMRNSGLPLFYAAGAGLTELAEALRVEPAISKRMILIWIGGAEYSDLAPGAFVRSDSEYNMTIDLRAAQTVFNESDIAIWQVPRNVYREMLISYAEIEAGLRPAGKLGRFLLSQLDRVISRMPGGLGETYILGDSALVTLTALQSSFDADSSSSPYVVRPTPRLDDNGRYVMFAGGRPMRVYTQIDSRLTFSDMFLKFARLAL